MEQFENFAKMSSSSDVCPCNLCERFIPNVEYNLYDGNFFLNFSRYLLVSKLLWFLLTLNKEMFVCMYVCLANRFSNSAHWIENWCVAQVINDVPFPILFLQ